MSIILIAIAAVVWVVLMTIQRYGGELIIIPVIGFVVGTLYVEEDGKCTFQIMLGLVSLTFIWYNE